MSLITECMALRVSSFLKIRRGGISSYIFAHINFSPYSQAPIQWHSQQVHIQNARQRRCTMQISCNISLWASCFTTISIYSDKAILCCLMSLSNTPLNLLNPSQLWPIPLLHCHSLPIHLLLLFHLISHFR